MLENFRSLFPRLACSVLASLVVASSAAAEPSNLLQLSLYDPIQMVSADSSVMGFRLTVINGANKDVTGLDIPLLVGHTSGSQVGLQIGGLLSVIKGDLLGAQIINSGSVEGEMRGLQLGAQLHAGSGVGLQLGLMNSVTKFRGVQIGAMLTQVEDLKGLQIGFINSLQPDVQLHEGDGAGVQAGVINSVKKFRGVQIGAIVNMADELKGLQIGLININKNGFLPIFPLVIGG